MSAEAEGDIEIDVELKSPEPTESGGIVMESIAPQGEPSHRLRLAAKLINSPLFS